MVVDDHPVFRIGMSALLRSMDGVEVVARRARWTRPSPWRSSTSPTSWSWTSTSVASPASRRPGEIVRANPAVGVLVVTMLGDDDSLFASIRAGARGYLLKGAAPAEVERAVRSVANGEILLGTQVAQRATTYLSGSRTRGGVVFPELTDREREVLDHVARGLDNATIARRLVLSTKTIRNYVYGILAKLDVPDRFRS